MPKPRLFAENLEDNQRSKCELRGTMIRERQEGGGGRVRRREQDKRRSRGLNEYMICCHFKQKQKTFMK